jgi:hypothetical protein
MNCDLKKFIEDIKKSPFRDMFYRKHIGHWMMKCNEREDLIGIEWRKIIIDTRTQKFVNGAKGAWRIFKNPHTNQSSNNQTKFYYHYKGCSCCSYPNWTPKQEGNPYANRNMFDESYANIIKGEFI